MTLPMSYPQGSPPSCEETLPALPAYALGAADGDEAARLRGHLPDCPDCRRELAGYLAVADALALAAPQAAPSRQLRGRVLAAAGAPAQRADPLRRLRRWLDRLPRELGSPRLSAALASLAIVVALAASLQVVRLQAELDRQLAAHRSLAAEMAAYDELVDDVLGPELVVRELQGAASAPGVPSVDAAAGSRGWLYLNPRSHSALLAAEDLPPLPADRVYQVWLIRDGQRTSAGLLVPDAVGRARLAIHAPEPLATYQAIGMTVEPWGGSPGPTTPRVLGGGL